MVVALVLVVALAAGFRLFHLGVSAFRADTMTFFDICQRPESGWVVFTQWTELLGRTAQLPFPLAITKCFIDVLHLPATAFMIRLPNALFGILTVLGMYMLGRQLAGRLFGLLLALWMAVNPFHIQLSREAYYYAPLLLGVTLQAWACLWAYRHRNQGTPFPIRFHVLTQIGFFLMMYSHFSGWWIGIFFTVFIGWVLGRRAWHTPDKRKDFWLWLTLSAVICLPLLFMSWALPFFLKDLFNPELKEQTKDVFGARQMPLVLFVWQFIKSASWGSTPIRMGFLVVTGGLTIAGLVFNWIRYRRAWILVMFLLGGLLIYWLFLISSGSYYAQRHVAYLLPLLICILAYGAWHISTIPFMHQLIASPVWRRVPAYGLAMIAVALNIQPAWVSMQLTGKPTPYWDIVHWCDTKLPRHTLILVDRWFEPWNELRVHNSTNVYFTFTIPNEPVDVYLKNRWRDTAKAFFEKYHDAGFLEIGSYYDRPEVGPWNWPSQYFARKVTFTNEAGFKLRHLGLAYRDSFYDANTNRLVISLYYNTREDAIAKARNQGKSLLLFFGPKWGYVKLWQQLRDFRDWRVLEKTATLDIYNLADNPQDVTVKIIAVAPSGRKFVQSPSGMSYRFQPQKIETWQFDLNGLKPGSNSVRLTDMAWDRTHIPLLVDRVEITAREAVPKSK